VDVDRNFNSIRVVGGVTSKYNIYTTHMLSHYRSRRVVHMLLIKGHLNDTFHAWNERGRPVERRRERKREREREREEKKREGRRVLVSISGCGGVEREDKGKRDIKE